MKVPLKRQKNIQFKGRNMINNHATDMRVKKNNTKNCPEKGKPDLILLKMNQ